MNREELFRERLRQLRTSRGISQNRLAVELGITNTGYKNYEYGTRRPTFEILPKLAVYFDVSTDYLLGLTDEPRLPSKETWAIIHEIEAQQAKQSTLP